MKLSTLFTVLPTTALAAVNVTFCSDDQCKDEPLVTLTINQTNQCRTDYLDRTGGFRFTSVDADGNEAPRFDEGGAYQIMRFYRSADCFGHCGSGHLVREMGGGGFFSRRFGDDRLIQSYELVDVDEHGVYAPHGYCGLRHGDAQRFRGRDWKWQQIGDGTFREVPIEEWNDEVHLKVTGDDYVFHGSVDSDGKTKMQQLSKHAWTGVGLEEWDDEVNARNESEDYFDEWMAEDEEDDEEYFDAGNDASTEELMEQAKEQDL